MPQFIMGLWMGCVLSSLVYALVYLKKKHRKEAKESKPEEKEESQSVSSYEASFLAPQVKVLVVDDSKLSRTVIKEFLKKTEMTFLEAASGKESIKLAQKNEPDLIILDQRMPGMDGQETLRRLWTEGGVGKEVPILAMSSGIRKENEEEFREKGYAGYIGKPIQGNRLEEVILKVLAEEKIVQKPEGFSYQNGLSNFDGNEEVYRETLVLFADLWEERKVQLKQLLKEGNMEEYAILIHAIKGDARTMGADILAKLAYEQEMKAKEGNEKAIRESFDRVIKMGDKTAQYFKYSFR